MKSANIKSVAEAAQVSITTVSNILSPRQGSNIRVSPATREKVLRAAAQLQYKPSYGAALLRSNRTRTIGFALALPQTHDSDFLSDYSCRILNGIGRAAARHNYQILLIPGDDYRSYMDVKRIDALIIVGYPLEQNPEENKMLELFEHFNRNHYPYVVINDHRDGLTPLSVEIDNAAGMSLAAGLIRRKKYETVGFIGEITANPQRHHRERIEALQLFLAGSGCRFDDDFIVNGLRPGISEVPRVGNFNHDDGKTALRWLLRNGTLPRCIVCGNDGIATGLLKEASNLGLRVPEELAVIGFDGARNTEFMTPALTTLRQNLESFGELAVDMVVEKIEHAATVKNMVMSPDLVERETT